MQTAASTRALRFAARGSSTRNGTAQLIAGFSRNQNSQPTAGAAQVVGNFLGQIAVPDQQVLRDPDVGPEGAEREQQLAEIVQMTVRHHVA